MKKLLLLSTLLAAFSSSLSAQKWVEMMHDPNANYYQVKAEFESYWETHDHNEKGKGYKVFKRWEHFVAPRVYPTGDVKQLNLTPVNFEKWKQQQATAKTGKPMGGQGQISSATYTAMGPFGAISGMAGNQHLKSGRLNFITIDPVDSNKLWVGAPAGGLWKSTNKGQSWTTNTDFLTVTGCSDLAIDPTNTNIMYLATGDGDGGDNRSIGVLKSTDGGQTWNPTGLTNPVSNYLLIRRLIINPNNPQILLAAANTGIYRTTNGGANWTMVLSGGQWYDLEFNPSDPSIVYAAGQSFRKSTNGGASFSLVSTGIPTTSRRMAIAVTPADSSYVYVLVGHSSNSGFQGLYHSTNEGTSFAVKSTTPNVLGWAVSGNDTGGQAWYDLCIAASPLNKDEVVVGGVNVWRSLDAGTNWSIYGHWTGSGGIPFTHADHHDLEYSKTGKLYNCNDGTVYYRTTTGWTEICGNMNISQIYRMGMSSLTPNKWITGHQDNGTSIFNGTTYQAEIGGDGMDCFFDRTNDNYVFAETQYGNLRRSTNGGATWSSATSGLPSTNGPWMTPWKQAPQTRDTLYCGYKQLYRSTDMAVSWTQVGSLPNSSADVREFAIAPSDKNVIYLLKSSGVYKSTNAGATWTTVTNGIPVSSAIPEYVCIDPSDPNNAWIVLSGYSNGNKIYMTTNGGSTWTNYSANLPNIPANCCVYQPGTNDRIYVGMDVGIYYRDANDNGWTLYNAGLPNVPVSELEISPANPGLLFAATYGRGVWKVDLVSNAPSLPLSNFSVNTPVSCTNKTITFTDLSTNLPISWNWSITPATGFNISSPTAQNPQVVFNATGVYTVQFQATNSQGAGTVASKTISVLQTPVVSVTGGAQGTVCAGTPINFTASGASSYAWSHGGGTGASASFTPQGSTVYTVTGTSNACPSSVTMAVNAQTGPPLTVTGPSTLCAGQQAILLASGSPNYSWSSGGQQTAEIVAPTANTVITVNGIGSNGCTSFKTHAIQVFAQPNFTVMSSDTMVCPGTEVSVYGAGADNFTWEPGSITGYTFTQAFTSTTTFTLYGVDHKGCTNVAYHTVTVDECASVPELLLNAKMSVYPNPGTGKFFVESSAGAEFDVIVTDVAGKVIYSASEKVSGNEPFMVDLSSYENGIYLLNLKSGDTSLRTFRLIRQEQ